MNNFHEILINQLAKESSFVTDDGELKKFIIIDAAFNMNRKLIELLLEVPEIKQKFFTEISGHWVFNINLFVQYMENKNFLKDSYTRYRNKIGLNIGGKFLNQRNEVSLVWPFKDCILEGGQSREDQKRPEIFFNEILAQEEIDQLTEPKVLTNWKRFTVEGEKPVTELKRENGTIKENLIIKGNNLLALHSILPQFEEKVKLIYIDPPYNTGGDSFQYNDSFNHSTWLTFMKNRLEVAKKLLRKDGVIFIHCDNNEQAYLKILLDEIFGREQFIETITVVNNPRGRDYGGIANMHESIHVYSKDQFNYEMYRLPDEEKEFPFKDKIGPYETRELRNRNTAFNDKNRPNLCYPFYVNPNKEIDNGFLEISIESQEGFIEVWPAKSQGIQTVWRWGKDKAKENLNTNIVGKKMQENGRYMIIEKYRENSRLARSVWWDKEVNSERGTVHMRELFGDKVFNFPKPETLMTRIIEISTIQNDIVLDYHLGSGTTATTAHKMNRQYIGIEQMDYIETVTIERLKKVIGKIVKPEGELLEKTVFDEGGISKAVNWQGGGEFVYCELKKYNQTFIEQIEEAQTSEQLLAIWEEMKLHSFLNYNVDIKKQDEAIDDFKQLSIETQKQHLCEIFNKNQLYVNLSSIDDEDYQVSEEDKRLTRDFYEIKEEKEIVQTKADL